MRSYLFVVGFCSFLCAQVISVDEKDVWAKVDWNKYHEIIDNFNLNKKISRTYLLSPAELVSPDPGKVAEALARIYEYRTGEAKWDSEKHEFIQISKHPGLLSQEMRKKFLGDIDGYDMSFLSDQFDECPCEGLRRQPGFISFRDLVEKKLADMIVGELEKSSFVRYVSVASGGYYFDYRVLRRVCLASKELKKKKVVLEVFFVDPEAPLIPDIEKLLQQPQYKCKNLELKLRTANIELKELSDKLCPTIIGGMDIGIEYVLSDLLLLTKKCHGTIKRVLIVGNEVVANESRPQITFLTLVAKNNKSQAKQLKMSGYEEYKSYVADPKFAYWTVYVKNFPFNEDGLEKFKNELEAAGMILSGDEKFLQKIDDLMNK